MTHIDEFPGRIRVLVLGGGIHGCGVAHDLASRGWRDVHLIERRQIAADAGSGAATFISGGLRYLLNFSGLSGISSRLREHQRLMDLAPDLITPMEFFLPQPRHSGPSRLIVKSKLLAHDFLSGRYRLARHRRVSAKDVEEVAPVLNPKELGGAYGFWDVWTDGAMLARRVAASARQLGATITEGAQVLTLEATADGWDVTLQTQDGQRVKISALYVVNCLGPRSNAVLERSGIAPTHRGVTTKSTQLILPNLGLTVGVYLPLVRESQKLMYLMPWQNNTVLGAMEDVYTGDLEAFGILEEEIELLLSSCNLHIKRRLSRSDILNAHTRLGWAPIESVDDKSRAYGSQVIGERASGRGLLLTIYSGEFDTYRKMSQIVGDKISTHFGEYTESGTGSAVNWAKAGEDDFVRPDAYQLVKAEQHVN